MEYVEFLRARRAFVIYVCIVFAVVAFATGSGLYGLHVSHHGVIVQENGSAVNHIDVPLGLILDAMSIPAMVLATILAASLNKENGVPGFAFTKPAPRTRIAARYIAIDALTIVLAYLCGVAIVLAGIAAIGIVRAVVPEPGWPAVGLAGLGAALMWYGVLQALTAGRRSGGGLFVGLSWPVFAVAAGLYQVTFLGPVFHGLVAAVDIVNPLAYFGFHSHNDTVVVDSLFGLSQNVDIAISWSLAAVFCAAAVAQWRRVEL